MQTSGLQVLQRTACVFIQVLGSSSSEGFGGSVGSVYTGFCASSPEAPSSSDLCVQNGGSF